MYRKTLSIFIILGVVMTFYGIRIKTIEEVMGIWDSTWIYLYQNTILSKPLTMAMAIPMVFILSFFVTRLFSWSKSKRIWAGGVLSLFFVVFFIFLHFYENKKFIDRCYATVPYSYGYIEVDCRNSIHPKYGTTVKPMTKEIALFLEIGERRQLTCNENLICFTPEGEPLCWYYKDINGQLQIFNLPGKHPLFGVDLKPVNEKVVRQCLEEIGLPSSKVVVVEETKPIEPKEEIKQENKKIVQNNNFNMDTTSELYKLKMKLENVRYQNE